MPEHYSFRFASSKLLITPTTNWQAFLRQLLSIGLFLVGLTGYYISAHAQTTGTAATLNNISSNVTYEVCQGPQANIIQIKNDASGPDAGPMSPVSMTLLLSPGGAYVPGSISVVAGSGIITESNITNLNRPVFTLPSIPHGGVSIDIQYQQQFGCSVIAYRDDKNPIRDDVRLTYTIGGTSYVQSLTNPGSSNVRSAILSILDVSNASYTGLLNDTFVQSVTLTNGGLGPVSTANLNLGTLGGVTVSNPSVGTLTTTGSGTSATARIALPSSLFGADGLLTNGEQVVVSYNVTVNSCNNLTGRTLTASWGCTDPNSTTAQICQTSSPPFPVGITISTAVASLSGTAAFGVANNGLCFLDSPVSVTYTFINIGTARTNSLTAIDVYAPNSAGGPNNGFGQFSLSTNATLYVVSAGNVQTPVSATAQVMQVVPSTSSFSCAIGAPNWVKHNLPANFTLQPGETLVIITAATVCQNTACGSSNPQNILSARAQYLDRCGTTIDSRPGGRISPETGISSLLQQMPVEVASGATFDIQLESVGYSQIRRNSKYLEFQVTLPPNFSYVAGSLLETSASRTAVAGYPQTSMLPDGSQLLTIRYSNTDPASGSVTSQLPETFLGGSTYTAYAAPKFRVLVGQPDPNNCVGGLVSVNTEVYYYSMSNYELPANRCTNYMYARKCVSNAISVICPVPCPYGGLSVQNYNYRRITFGLPDNNQDGIPDTGGSIDLNKVDVNRYRPGDVLRTNSEGKIVSGSAVSSWNYVYAEWNFNAGDWASEGPASVTVVRAGSFTAICPSVPVQSVVANRQYKLDWSGISNCLPVGYIYQPGDRVYIQADFRLTTTISNNGSTQAITALGYDSPTTGVVDQSFYATLVANAPPNSGTAIEGGPNRWQCGSISYGYNLLGMAVITGSVSSHAFPGSCLALGQNIFYNNQILGGTNGKQYFPFEFRPISYPDEVSLQVPIGYSVDLTFNFPINSNYTLRPTVSAAYSCTNCATVTGNPATGQTITWNVQAYIASHPNFVGTDGANINFNYRLIPTCSSPASGTGIVYVRGHYADYPSVANPYTFALTRNLVFTLPTTARPALALATAVPNIVTTSSTASWSLTLQNTNTNTSSNTYLRIISPGNFQNITITDVAANTVVVPDANGIYRIGTFNGNTSRVYVITGALGQCASSSLTVGYGWDCSTYPTGAGACEQNLNLSAQGFPAGLDATFNFIPTGAGNTVELCQPVNFTATINSTQVGALGEVLYTVNLPTGMTYVSNSLSYVYPTTASKALSSYNPTIVGNQLQFRVTQVAAALNGGLAGVGSPATKEVSLYFQGVTQCGMPSGAAIQAGFNGTAVCGDALPAIVVNSSPLSLAGAVPTSQFVLAANVPPLQACGPTQTISILGTQNSTVATAGNEDLRVTLPATVQYVPGSALPSSVTVTTTTGGGTLLRFPVPAGLANGQSFTATLAVQSSNTLCVSSSSIDFETIQTLSVDCGGNACVTPVRSGALLQVPVAISKANLAMISASVSLSSISSTQEAGSLTLTVSNAASTTANPSNTLLGPIIVDIINDLNKNGVYDTGEPTVTTTMIGAGLAPGSTTSVVNSLTLPAGICALIARTNPTLNTCNCPVTERPVQIASYNTGLQSVSTCVNQPVTLSGIAMTGYGYSWLGLNGTGIGPLSSITTANPIFNTNIAGTYIYRVDVTRSAGCTPVSQTATVTVTAPAVLTVNSSAACIGSPGSLTVLGCTGGTLHWSTGATTQVMTVPSVTGTEFYSVTCLTGTCSATAQSFISANPSVTATIAGSSSFCAGGAILLTAIGSSNFRWNTGATTQTLSVSVAGIYSVTATGEGGCSDVASITISQNPAVTATITGNQTICAGVSTTLTASGGNTYVWSTGASTSAISVSVAGPYSVTVSNASTGCSGTATVTVVVNPLPVVAPASATVCEGQLATFTATGASSYTWSTGATTQTISVTAAGVYSLTGRSAAGCASVSSATLVVNPLPSLTLTSTSICAGQTATLALSGTSTGETYLWNTGETTTAISVSTAGPYSVTALSALGCSLTLSATVTINSLPILTLASATICAGQTATLTASGASSYTWSTGATTAAISVSVAGPYSVTGTSAQGCSSTTSATLTVNPAITATIAGNLTVCAGNATTLTASGGDTYLWSTAESTSAISVSVAGPYSVTVSNPTTGCSSTTSATLTVNPLPSLTVTSVTVCAGQSATLTASGAASYTWSSGQTTASISISVAGTYSVTGMSVAGCTTVASGTLVVNELPSLTVTSATVCVGQSATLTASGASSYIWSNGQTTASISVSVAGTYSITGTSAAGCTASSSAILTVNALPSLTLTSVTVCAGQSATLTASGASSYTWSSGQTTASISVGVAGTYSVTGTSAAGCTISGSATLTVNALPSLTVTSATICAGQSATLTASGANSYTWSSGETGPSLIVSLTATTPYSVSGTSALGCTNTGSGTVTVNGQPVIANILQNTICVANVASLTVDASINGSGTLEYSLNGGAFSTTNSFTISAPVPTTATVVVRTQGSSCSATQSIIINCSCQNPVSLSLTPVSPQVCAGGIVSLSVGMSGAISASLTSTGTGTFSQSVVSGGNTVLTYQPSVADATAGSVTLTLQSEDPDGAGSCLSAQLSRILTINPLPSVTVTSATVCAGATGLLTASGASSYTWADGTVGATLSVSVAGTYALTATSSLGCSSTASATLTVNALPSLTLISATVCAGSTGTLTASGASSYTWSTGTSGATVLVSTAGTYSVTGTSSLGCSSTASATLTVNPLPSLTVTSANVCAEGSAALTASGASSYTWSTGGAGLPATTASISVSTAGTYSVTGTSAAGCSSVGSATLTVTNNPSLTLASATICAGATGLLTASGANSYTWSDGTMGATLSTSVAGTYSVTGTIAGGCTASASATLTVNPLPSLTLTSATVCQGQTGTLMASGAASYTWTGGITGATLPVSVAGTYSVTGTSALGCSATASATLTVNPLPSLTITSASICAGGSAAVTASGASSYSWSTGGAGLPATTASISVSTAGTYSVTGISAAGCSAIGSATLTVSNNPSLTVTSATICAGQTATLTASGASSYLWSTGTNTPTLEIAPTATTTYSVTGISSVGCRSVASTAITVNGQPQITSITQSTLCVNTVASFTVNATISGNGTLEYSLNGGGFTSASNFTINAPSSTTATVVVRTVGSSCTATQPVVINCACQNSASLTFIPTNAQVCAGNVASFTVGVSGASSATLSSSGSGVFSQSTLTGLTTVTYQPSPADIAAGNVSLTLQSADPDGVGSCAAAQLVRVLTINPLPVVTVTSATICAGQSTTLTASGGANSFTWTGGQTTASITVSTAGVYSVTGRNGAGCIGTGSGTLTVNAYPAPTVANVTICPGQPALLTVQNCAGSVRWSANANNAHTSTVTVTPSVATVYTVSCTVGGCTAATSATVSLNGQPVIGLVQTGPCTNGVVSVTINASISGGSGSLEYSLGLAGAPFRPFNVFNVGATSGFNWTIGVRIVGTTCQATSSVFLNCACANPATVSLTPAVTASCGQSPISLTAGVTVATSATVTRLGSGVLSNTLITGTTTLTYTPSVADVSAGRVTLVITSADPDGFGGCEPVSLTRVITLNPLPSLTVTSATVCAGSVGVLTASGATSYIWSNGATTASISVTTAGVYSVTGRSASGCVAVSSGSLTVNPLPSLTVTSTSVCAGGLGVLTASGAASYLWNIGATTPTVSVSVAGVYSVTGISSAGCVATSSSSLTVHPLPSLSVTSTTICAGSIGVLMASGATTYAWNNGAATPSISVSTAGVYSVTGVSSVGCSIIGSGTVVVNSLPSLTVASTSICAGGVGVITASGGASYVWDTGATTASISVSVAGVHSVTATSVAGCQSAGSGTLTINPLPSLTVTSATVCAGSVGVLTASGAANYQWSTGARGGSVTVTAAGVYSVTGVSLAGCTVINSATLTVNSLPSLTVTPATICAGQSAVLTATGAASYLWNNGATTASVTATSAGVYSVTGVSDAGCVAVGNSTLTVNPLPSLTITSATVCAGSVGQLTASGASTYQWSTGQTTATISVSVAGVYSVTGASAAGCVGLSSGTVVINSTPSLSVTSASVCSGNEGQLTASGASTYRWSNGATTPSISVSTAGVYSVTGVSAAGCMAVGSGTLTVNTPPSLTVTSATVCAGDVGVLTASGATSYQWNTGGTTASISVSVAGIYSVTGVSAQGCVAFSSGSLIVNPLPSLSVTSASICAGEAGQLTGSGADRYLWSTGATTPSISVSVAGVYSVTGTSSAGCVATSSGSLQVNAAVQVSVSPASICEGQSAMLTASGAASYTWSTGATTSSITATAGGVYSVTGSSQAGCVGPGSGTLVVNTQPSLTVTSTTVCAGSVGVLTGSGANSYLWSNGATTATISVSVAGVYSVTGVSSAGCVAISSATLTVNALPSLSVTSATVCAGSVGVLTASGATTYQWNTGATTPSISVSTAGVYSVTGINLAGCTATDSGTLTVNSLPSLTVTSATICSGQSATLTASGADSYLWSTGATGSSITNSTAGVYSVTGVSAAGCVAVGSGTLTVNTPPSLTVTSATVCTGEVGQLTATGADSYIWSTGGAGLPATTPTVSLSVAGVYSVTGTTTGGCTALGSATLTVSSPPSLTITSVTLCGAQSATLTASGATAYVWSTGATTATIYVSATGLYSVTGTSAAGCRASQSVNHVQPKALSLVSSATAVVCSSTNTGAVSVLVSGGITPYQYRWNTGATTASLANLPVGSYTLTVTDTNGCTATITTSVSALTCVMPTVGISSVGNSSTLPAGTDTISGTATPGSTVTLITSSGQKVITAADPLTGAYSFSGLVLPTGPNSVTVIASDPNGVSTPFVRSFIIAAPISGAFALLTPVYNCTTGAISFSTSGGNGSSVEYFALGITPWTTATSFTIEAGLRNDPKPITIFARQNGVTISFIFDLVGACDDCTPGKGNPLRIRTPVLDCYASTITIPTCGGDGTPIQYRIVDVVNWSAYNLVMVGDDLVHRDPKVVFIQVQQGDNPPVTIDYNLPAVSAQCPADSRPWNNSTPTTPPPGSVTVTVPGTPTGNTGLSLSLVEPLYSCPTGVLTFRYAGGDGTLVEYMAVGVTGWSSQPIHHIDEGVRLDQPVLTLFARQSGMIVSRRFDIRAYCGGTPNGSPGSATTVAVSTPTPTDCGSPTSTLGQPLVVTGVTDISCATGSFRILMTGGNGQPVNFAGIVGLNSLDPYNCVRKVDGADLVAGINNPASTVSPFILRVIQVGNGVSSPFSFDFKAYCTTANPSVTGTPGSTTSAAPASPVEVSNPTPTHCGSPTATLGQPLVITGVSEVNCATGSFRILTTGGNGLPINFAGIVGLSSLDPYNCVRVVDGADLLAAVNNPTSSLGAFMVRGNQVGGSSTPVFSVNLRAYCTGSGRTSRPEPVDDLSVTVLGNPTLGETVEVVVTNTGGSWVDLRVSTAAGQVVSEQRAESAGNEARTRVQLGRSAGVYLIQVSTPSRTKLVKVVRQ